MCFGIAKCGVVLLIVCDEYQEKIVQSFCMCISGAHIID